MKKYISLVMAFVMMLSLSCACAAELNDGVYTATTDGRNGPLTLMVTTVNGEIAAIEVGEHTETAGIADPALTTLVEDIVAYQSIGMDAVAGATITSDAVFAAVADCIAQAGGNAEDYKNPVVKEVTAPTEYVQATADIVVIGGGAAGLSAAIEAAQAGKQVVLLEKQAALGGSTSYSGGAVMRNATAEEAAQGNALKDDELVAYFMHESDNTADEEWVRYVVEQSGPANEWLIDLGHNRTTMFYEASNAIIMCEWGESGAQMVGALQKKAEELGVQIVLNTAATELVLDNGMVSGVKAVSGSKEIAYDCDAVILATGGYIYDADLVREHTALGDVLFLMGGAGNSGDGLKMAETVNAKTTFKGPGLLSSWNTMTSSFMPIQLPSHLMVNTDGNRFVNEHQFYSRLANDAIKANVAYFNVIFDNDCKPDTIEAGVEDGTVFKAETIAELAGMLGVDPAALEATVVRYNDMCAKGIDEDFGKDAKALNPIENGPFYGVGAYPMAIGTFGGLSIDMNGQVLDVNDVPIANLYAAGAVANADFFGEVYPMSGSCLMHAVVTGRLAGQSASK